jgi:Sec-independent protein translocase protein TatA
MTEWIMVSIVVALVFSATRVPAVGDWLGRLVLGPPEDASRRTRPQTGGEAGAPGRDGAGKVHGAR